jgi:radical SAM protein with 4Fe4S-binding SPASM domain
MSDNKKDAYYKLYNYNTLYPVYIDVNDLRKDQFDRLMNSEVFCMMPWIHIHGFPDGRAYPCCLGEIDYPIGNLRKDDMKTIWNSDAYKRMRTNMIEEKSCKECTRCYEQEANGFTSNRISTNKNFGHHIGLVDQTESDGHVEDFKLRYYDIRFSNLCNFSCRTCGGLFSSSWYPEETSMNNGPKHPQFMYAGKTENDMWEQMLPHIPYIEQVYFAGGEPLIMEEHYRLLKELVNQERFDVKIIYNTNFSRLNLKDEDVLDYWRLFKEVGVGASLDGSYARGEYIRKGTKWDQIVRNRERMIEKCPNTDFYVSSTVSLFNVLHVADFHREWVELGLVKAQDWNINILQSPTQLRIDVLPQKYKDQVREKIEQHIDWLSPQDHLGRATSGFRGILNFITEDKSDHLEEFFRINDKSDDYREEKFITVFPEYADLRTYVTT